MGNAVGTGRNTFFSRNAPLHQDHIGHRAAQYMMALARSKLMVTWVLRADSLHFLRSKLSVGRIGVGVKIDLILLTLGENIDFVHVFSSFSDAYRLYSSIDHGKSKFLCISNIWTTNSLCKQQY